MTKDEMVGWHHRLDGRELEQTTRDGEGQGSLACCSPWGYKKSDMTEQLNNNKTKITYYHQTQKSSECCFLHLFLIYVYLKDPLT